MAPAAAGEGYDHLPFSEREAWGFGRGLGEQPGIRKVEKNAFSLI